MPFRKIINDPVYGFITIDRELVHEVIAHPAYQRLRRIHQMALAQLVYPGAVHTRLHHSLGAYHLMGNALTELKGKGIQITEEESVAAKVAILLHDLGHGPYSHALEQTLIAGVNHEDISLLLMEKMNKEMGGKIQMAIDIFTNRYHKKFLHQLVSGQLDVDRMDYLTRDSFFTGVSEGVIGYDRILKMLTVHEGELMIEEKGIYSIEKFLVARRLMYWQVYLHKTVLCAEMMLVNIIRRAKKLNCHTSSDSLDHFLNRKSDDEPMDCCLEEFCKLDDYDVMFAIKEWAGHEDIVLSLLSTLLLNRKLLKVKYLTEPVSDDFIQDKRREICKVLSITEEESAYLVFKGTTQNSTYNTEDERINILFKDGSVKDISQVDHALIQQTLSGTVKKFYICYPEVLS
ncbi:MAG: HD domain-containing protein [Chitinophagaceae bacterium]